jgi:hypothetical protein
MLTNLFKHTIALMLLERANELLAKPANSLTYCNKIPQNPSDCKYEDFRNLSSMTDISISTLNRLFKCEGHSNCLRKLNTTNQKKIVQFLGLENWLTVETEAFKKVVEKEV